MSGDGGAADHSVMWAKPPPGSRRMTRNGPASPPSPGEPAASHQVPVRSIVLPCNSCRQTRHGPYDLLISQRALGKPCSWSSMSTPRHGCT